jgi:hypothetical protein
MSGARESEAKWEGAKLRRGGADGSENESEVEDSQRISSVVSVWQNFIMVDLFVKLRNWELANDEKSEALSPHIPHTPRRPPFTV